MSDYQLIRTAISFYENLARTQHGDKFVKIATNNFDDLNAKYYSKTDNPDYGPNIKKFCYLYKYSVAHGYYIFSVLKRLGPKIKPAIFSRSPTKIACIGGGPGTEIIGLCRYLRDSEPGNIKNPIEITIYDKELTWQDSCKIITSCAGVGIQIDLKFIQFDATDVGSYQNLDFSKFHMVMANFFISEIRKAKIVGATARFWKHLFASMGSGKVFIALDFADTDGFGWKHLNGILPINHVVVLSDETLKMSCPDSKICIQELETELDHRPKKNATNFVKAIIT